MFLNHSLSQLFSLTKNDNHLKTYLYVTLSVDSYKDFEKYNHKAQFIFFLYDKREINVSSWDSLSHY